MDTDEDREHRGREVMKHNDERDETESAGWRLERWQMTPEEWAGGWL